MVLCFGPSLHWLASVILHLGRSTAMVQHAHQEARCQKLLFPNVRLARCAREGEGPHRRVCGRGGMGHTCVRFVTDSLLVSSSSPCIQWEYSSREKDRHPSHLRNRHVPVLRQMDTKSPRSPSSIKSMELSSTMGIQASAALPANTRVSVAGGTYSASD